MLSNIDVVRLIRKHFLDRGQDLVVYPKAFPLDTPDVSATVDIFSSTPPRAGLFTLTVNIQLRAKHPSVAEAKILEITKFLDGLSGLQLGSTYLLTSRPLNPYPSFLGSRANEYYQYSSDFSFLLDYKQ